MTQQINQPQAYPAHHAEKILVVKREFLFKNGAWNGLKKVDFDDYLKIITDHQEFHPRYAMETDPTYKQIIPYLVFRYQDQYFLMERDKKASEARLASKLTLGIGGHIHKEDMAQADIFTWAIREFHEEVNYTGNLKITPLGILNDDSNLVGQVHIGFVFLLEGDSDAISIKSELAGGTLVTLDECKALKERMEGWSQTTLESLI
jgi:predicted NUDIX family phosphoesterase